MGFANVRAGTKSYKVPELPQFTQGVLPIQKGTRVLISLWDSLMFGRVPKKTPDDFLGTRPNISESHSEISTLVPFVLQGITAT